MLGLALLVQAFAVALVAAPSRADDPAQARPNIVVIMTDDERVSDLAYAPAVQDLLAAQGVTFDNSFVSYSLCCPSRATYLTGQYAHNHRVLSNAPPKGGYARLDGTRTLPVWLKRAGYHTGHIGKYLNRYGAADPVEVPPGWDEWFASPGHVFAMYDYRINCQPPVPECGGTPDPDHIQLRRHGHDPSDYRTDVEIALARSFISRNASLGTAPFFLSLAPVAPHGSYPGEGDTTTEAGMPLPADRYLGAFAGLDLPPKPSFNERNVSDKPGYVRRRSRFTAADLRDIRRRYQRRLESLLAVDDMVRAVVSALEDAGELQNTYILFTTDNGYMLGEHRMRLGKVAPYEESIRVPLIVRGPGVPAGQVRHQFVSNVDLAPTIAAMGSATDQVDLEMDGTSLLPAIDLDEPISRALLFETYEAHAYRGIRLGRWAYFRYRTGETELYDLKADPYELANRAHRVHGRATRTRLRRLSRLLDRLQSCSGDACRQAPPRI